MPDMTGRLTSVMTTSKEFLRNSSSASSASRRRRFLVALEPAARTSLRAPAHCPPRREFSRLTFGRRHQWVFCTSHRPGLPLGSSPGAPARTWFRTGARRAGLPGAPAHEILNRGARAHAVGPQQRKLDRFLGRILATRHRGKALGDFSARHLPPPSACEGARKIQVLARRWTLCLDARAASRPCGGAARAPEASRHSAPTRSAAVHTFLVFGSSPC